MQDKCANHHAKKSDSLHKVHASVNEKRDRQRVSEQLGYDAVTREGEDE
ncbi:hypothetical protein AB00_2420 [Raoultella ornithinolytica 2-156-04_S1_C1]|nr:hypothetical protein AB00_2420 [Raoultella ornithinolytica 2-156-04_S1_C1]